MDSWKKLPPLAKGVPLAALDDAVIRKEKNGASLYLIRQQPRANSVPLQQRKIPPLINFFNTPSNGKDSSQLSIAKFKREMEKDEKNYHSLSTWCSVTLRKVQSETRLLPAPNPLRTAVCSMLLSRIAPHCQPYEALIPSLVQELLSSIYVGWDEYMSRKLPPSKPVEDDDAFEAINKYDGEIDETSTYKTSTAALNQRQTYFQALHDLQKQRIQFLGRPAKVLKRCIHIWESKVLQLHFTAWAKHTRQTKIHEQRGLAVLEIKLRRKAEQTLRSHFQAFRKYVFERRHQCSVVYEESKRQKLLQRMGRRIQELEDHNRTLSHDWDTLLAEHREIAHRLRDMKGLFDDFKIKINQPADDPLELLHHEQELLTSQLEDQNLEEESRTLVQNQVQTDTKEQSEKVEATSNITETEALHMADEVRAMPNNKLDQLKNYLNLENVEKGERTTLRAATPQEPTEKNKSGDSSQSKKIPESISHREVLDWVSLRIQMIITHKVVLRRCTNFTTDFKDSARLAYLFVSLGADKTLLDDIATAGTLLLRADVICRTASFFFSSGERYFDKSLQPLDIVKAKGGKISHLLFCLYEKFSSLSVVRQTALQINPRVAQRTAEDSAVKEEFQEKPEENHAAISDHQFMEWYRDLADDDSEVELEPDEYTAAKNRRKTNIQAVTERLASHVSFAMLKTERQTKKRERKNAPNPKSITGSHPLEKAPAQKRPKDHLILAKWISEKLAFVNGGAELSPEKVVLMSTLDLLEGVTKAVFPEASSSASTTDGARIAILEKNLSHFLRKPVKLGQQQNVADGKFSTSLTQLLTALYLHDRDVLVTL